MSGLMDVAQAASNAVAGNVSGPVDMLAFLLRKAGVPVPEDPVLGTEWLKKRGLIRDVPQGAAQVAGETLGLLAPVAVAAKAPQIASGLLRAQENAAAPRTLRPDAGAIVWHGSPHKFDRFDSSKIGTGEGAQAYGHGLYLAESPSTAEFYKGSLTDRFPAKLDGRPAAELSTAQRSALGILNDYGGNVDSALAFAKRDMQKAGNVGAEFHVDRYNTLLDIKKGKAAAEVASPSLYKVDLPDEKIARMLDWDKPLSQQPLEVREALSKVPGVEYAAQYFKANRKASPTGADMHDFLRYSGIEPFQIAPRMQEAGIPGIRYLDGGSRGAGSGTSNFVVFPGEEGLLTILERNGVPLGR